LSKLFDPSFRSTTFEDLWSGLHHSVNFLLVVFERFEGPGVQSILDLLPYRRLVGIRRAPATSPLVGMLKITQFPYVALFKRGDQQSIFMDKFVPYFELLFLFLRFLLAKIIYFFIKIN
jgi:hypothetical protein